MQNQNEQQSSLAVLQDEISIIPASKEITSTSTSITGLISNATRFLPNLIKDLAPYLGQTNNTYVTMMDAGNHYALVVGSRKLNNHIREKADDVGLQLRNRDILEINEHLRAYAEKKGIIKHVYFRVAPIDGGIEIDAGDENHTRYHITNGKVEIISEGSEVIFFRTPSSQAMVMPAEVGDVRLLEKYLNMHPAAITLLIGWLSYTLAHPKAPTSKYVILVLQGGEGSGKSLLCRFIAAMIDPNSVGLRHMPSNSKDLAIASQNAHVLAYDNVRGFKHAMADMLCIAATGGAVTSRQLYTDSEQHVLQLHVALVLNGKHSFIDQPDLAQRCLPVELLTIKEGNRKSEAELVREFEADLPAIMRGLFDLIANIFKHLPTAQVTSPERMYDFVKWLAAMEMAQGAPSGVFQAAYSEALNQGQLDSLMEDTLAATVVDFAHTRVDVEWSGTPAELLVELNKFVSTSTQRSREWPQNPISLSKRLKPLQVGLLTQGIYLEFTRGKQRTITIRKEGQK